MVRFRQMPHSAAKNCRWCNFTRASILLTAPTFAAGFLFTVLGSATAGKSQVKNSEQNPIKRCFSIKIFKTMGASESTLSSSQTLVDEITTVSERSEVVDPVLGRLKSLKISKPILTGPPTESSLTDILVRKPALSSAPGALDPKVLEELFSVYRDYQEDKVKKISKNQEEIENKIEVAEALAVKLFQRLNHSVSAMKTTSQNLSEVHALQVETGELKGRLTEVISNCDALCRRIITEGPESLRSSLRPFAATCADSEITSSSSSSLQRMLPKEPSLGDIFP